MKSNEKQAAKVYLENRDYKMTITKDDGVFRVLDFKHNNSTDGCFTITTWPNHLCISGDMGTFVFSRIYDMVDFFKGDVVSPSYWSEKVKSESMFGKGVQSFSIEEFEGLVSDYKEEAIESGIQVGSSFDLLDEVEDEFSAVEFIRSFYLEGVESPCFDLPSAYTFTFHYLFACYAVNFACNKYSNLDFK